MGTSAQYHYQVWVVIDFVASESSNFDRVLRKVVCGLTQNVLTWA